MKLAILLCLLFPAGLRAQQLKPETAQSFDCYVQSAEARMDARKAFLLADADTALDRPDRARPEDPHHRGQRCQPAQTARRPALRLDRRRPLSPAPRWTGWSRMLQDYDHRAQYFPETISTSKLLCRHRPRPLSILHAHERTRHPGRRQRRGVGARGRAALALPLPIHARRRGGQRSRLPAPPLFLLAIRRNAEGRLRGGGNHHPER